MPKLSQCATGMGTPPSAPPAATLKVAGPCANKVLQGMEHGALLVTRGFAVKTAVLDREAISLVSLSTLGDVLSRSHLFLPVWVFFTTHPTTQE